MPWVMSVIACIVITLLCFCFADMYVDIFVFERKQFIKSVNWPKPGYASITCLTISYIPYNLIFTTKFNDSSILITIISCDYLNLSLADEHVGDVTIPTQVIE
jgi:hypothetical protein